LNVPLHIANLSVGFGKNILLSGVELALNEGELVAITGRNGTGKTTLLKTAAGLLKPLKGQVNVNGKNIHEISTRERAKHISYVSTERVRLGGIDVKTVVAFGRYAHASALGWTTNADELIAQQCMENLSIRDLANKSLAELSDGELQKVMIACALTQQTSVIIMDEPTAFLDYVAKEELFVLLKRISIENRIAILLSSHDIQLVEKFSDRVFVAENNCVVEVLHGQ